MATITEVYNHARSCTNCCEDYKQLTIEGQSVLNIVHEYARVRQVIRNNGIKDKEELSVITKQWEYCQLAIDVLSKKLGVKELNHCVKIANCSLQMRSVSKL
jgi:hypothetical protein